MMGFVQDASKRMGRVQISEGKDFSGLSVDGHIFYYGYKYGQAGDDVWGFEYAHHGRTIFSINYDKMKAFNKDDVPPKTDTLSCLVFGIGLFLAMKGGEQPNGK